MPFKGVNLRGVARALYVELVVLSGCLLTVVGVQFNFVDPQIVLFWCSGDESNQGIDADAGRPLSHGVDQAISVASVASSA